ncbi:protein-L-isoaspartate(D-aspartate) O-methyltransferase [Ancylobacter sp. MQZ15Z-1]|uniref:Protein-L-isoaspartate O-methyltransferase n=1 Tax=Ancylobacter mangrovi TaxID=2972472 RepID=A0A9X2T2H6_9HYPH|nr:protein-L-isoaspartate(D-aspartate) O-methyltransferase [Ancylobacter mangrovi]MCS0495877.1 protein-L-isoaspartate(D-aspartate) O-methyltransferase [Ancylobacter mangrovi]
MTEAEKNELVERAELLLALRRRGLLDNRVMRAFEEVPRERFVDPAFRDLAWADQTLPIECGQTISQPSVIASMTQALEFDSTHSVLEVGTGTGYQAAIMGHIARRVVTLERYRTLAHSAAVRLRQLGLANVEVIVADGTQGLFARAPFDRIVLTAAVSEVPAPLIEQLAPEGILIAPLGPPDDTQTLVRLRKPGEGREGQVMERRDLGRVRFVPIMAGIAASL